MTPKRERRQPGLPPVLQTAWEQIGSHGKLIFVKSDGKMVCGICEQTVQMDKSQVGSFLTTLVDQGYEGHFWGKIRNDRCLITIEKPLKAGWMALDASEYHIEEVSRAAA